MVKLPKPTKPLGSQPDQVKHEAPKSPEDTDEEDFAGSMPDPERVTGADQDQSRTTADMAEEVGLDKASEEDEGEVRERDSDDDLTADEQDEWES